MTKAKKPSGESRTIVSTKEGSCFLNKTERHEAEKKFQGILEEMYPSSSRMITVEDIRKRVRNGR